MQLLKPLHEQEADPLVLLPFLPRGLWARIACHALATAPGQPPLQVLQQRAALLQVSRDVSCVKLHTWRGERAVAGVAAWAWASIAARTDAARRSGIGWASRASNAAFTS